MNRGEKCRPHVPSMHLDPRGYTLSYYGIPGACRVLLLNDYFYYPSTQNNHCVYFNSRNSLNVLFNFMIQVNGKIVPVALYYRNVSILQEYIYSTIWKETKNTRLQNYSK
jgi:hypothetical protein